MTGEETKALRHKVQNLFKRSFVVVVSRLILVHGADSKEFLFIHRKPRFNTSVKKAP